MQSPPWSRRAQRRGATLGARGARERGAVEQRVVHAHDHVEHVDRAVEPEVPVALGPRPPQERPVLRFDGGVRRAVELLDVFVGRYLLLTTVAYVGIKFIHFKVFDPIPF